MNRWIRWADRLRRRHSRRERDGVQRTMVLAHRATAITSQLFTNRRTIVHLHAHISVLSMPGPAMFVRCVTARAATAVGPLRVQGRTAAGGAPLPASDGPGAPAQALVVRTAPAFVRRSDVLRHDARPATERRSGALQDALGARVGPMPSLRRPAVPSAAHADLPGRLRRRAVREELPIPGRTTVLVRAAAAVAAGARQRDEIEREFSAAARSARTPPVAAPAVNVEALTSQVIQQLDRRLLAYRERMGKV